MKSISSVGALAKLSLTAQLPPRPGYGTAGRMIQVFANYYRVRIPPDLSLTRYNVEVAPEAKGRKLTQIFRLLLELPKFANVVTDGGSMIVSRAPLDVGDGDTLDIVYRAEGQEEPLERAQTYQIRFVTPTTFAVGDYVNYLSSTSTNGPVFENGPEIVQALNTLVGHQPKTNPNVVTLGQRHFSIDRLPEKFYNIRDLTGGLESLRGYFQSIRAATGSILLNVNITHGVFFQSGILSILLPKCKWEVHCLQPRHYYQ